MRATTAKKLGQLGVSFRPNQIAPVEVAVIRPIEIVLTMIVKNEAHVIERCLSAAKPFIDRWVVCDTGSTDGTQDVVRNVMKDVPGDLVEIPWEGFGKCRTRAFDIAFDNVSLGREGAEHRRAGPATYALVLDADEIIEKFPDRQLFAKRLSSYQLLFARAGQTWPQNRLFQLANPDGSSQGWKYVGVRHEFPTRNGTWAHEVFSDLKLASPGDGGRSKVGAKEKFAGDAIAIEEALKTEPDAALRTRYMFYLAQSWRDAGSRGGGPEDDLAARYYLERAEMGGGSNWEEVYVALLEAGRALNRRGKCDEALKVFWRAYWHWPARVEATRELEAMFRWRVQTSPKHGTLFVEP